MKNILPEINDDPWEITNLKYPEGYEGKVREPGEKLEDWQTRTNDSIFLPID